MYQLPTVHVAGTPRAMGRAYGEACRGLIQAFVAQRLRAAKVYLWERGIRGTDGLIAAAHACQGIAATWDPDGYEEHLGIAEGADVAPAELYAATQMTDVRDVVLYPEDGPETDTEGCTSLLVHGSRTADGELIAAQTWDLNPGDLDYVVAVHRRPDKGPESWSVTCAGSLSLVGLNEHGLWVGTTNIKTRGTRPGIGYLSLLHRLIGCTDVATAADVLERAPRSAAHTYWLADAKGGCRYECSMDYAIRRDLEAEGLCQTNHCIEDQHCPLQAEETGASSAARLARTRQFLTGEGIDIQAVEGLFRDRSDGVDSINRYPEDDQGTATNSCMIAIPAKRLLRACKGPADRGEWIELAFG